MVGGSLSRRAVSIPSSRKRPLGQKQIDELGKIYHVSIPSSRKRPLGPNPILRPGVVRTRLNPLIEETPSRAGTGHKRPQRIGGRLNPLIEETPSRADALYRCIRRLRGLNPVIEETPSRARRAVADRSPPSWVSIPSSRKRPLGHSDNCCAGRMPAVSIPSSRKRPLGP